MKVKVRKLAMHINVPCVPPAVTAYFENIPFKITYISRGKPVHKAERAEKKNTRNDVITLNQEMINLASAKALSSIRQCRYLNP